MLLEAFLNIIARYNLLLDGHPARVFLYSSLLLEKIPITLKEKEKINTAAYLHDIGKLFIKNNILNKNGSLNREEKNYARTQTLNSISVLFHFGFEKDLIEMVLLHHERTDGKGYPFGIKGDEIPLGSKVTSIADAFDSMTSYRTYRANPLSPQEAQKELIRCSKTQFDPLLVRLFIESLNQSKSGKIHINPKSEGEAVCPKVSL